MTARVAHGRSKFLLVAVLVPLAVPAALAQKDAVQSSDKKTSTFDAVTIKPSDSASRGRSWGMTLNTYSAKNAPLAQVILQAYLGGTASIDRLKGAPEWVMNDRYDITAKVDDRSADGWRELNQEQQMAMAAPLLRTMLEERCKLVVHTESTEISGYALVVGKHGIKMKVAPPDEPLPTTPYGKIKGDGIILFSYPGYDAKQSRAFRHTTMASLLAFFNSGGIPLLDQTGLNDRYDFELPKIDTDPPDGSASIPQPDLAHQYDWGALGLEMKPVRIPARNLVIDHIEKPSPN